MPVVPISPGQTVGPSQTPTVRPPLDAFGGGEAARPVDLSGLVDTADKIRQQAKARADQVAVVAAGAQLSALESKTLYDPQSGYLNTRGMAAVSGLDDVGEGWRKQTADIASTLTNDDQKIQFQRMAQAHWDSVNEQSQRHASAEAQSYDQQSTAAYLSNEGAAAVSAGLTDPKRVQQSIDNQGAAIRDFGARQGWGPEQIAEHVAQATSKTRFDVLERMVDTEQDQAAASYLTLHRADFVGKDLTDAEKLTNAGSVRAESQRQADRITAGDQAAGLVTPGNIDLTKRPRVQNADGSISTVRSMSFEENGKEILVPTVSEDGKILTNDEAIQQYHDTGKHLGIFANEAAANDYAERLHDAQAAMIAGQGSGIPAGPATNLADALSQVSEIQDPKVRDATEQRVRRTFADKAADERQQRDKAFSDASATVEQTGDFGKVPMSTRVLLSPDENEQLQRRAESIAHPQVVTNIARYTSLMNMASLNDATKAEFAGLDLNQYKGELSDPDIKHLSEVQREIRNGAAKVDAKDAAKTATGDVSLKRKQEATAIKQSDDATKRTAAIAAAEKVSAGAGKYLPPAARVVVPQWMVDSAAKSPDYAAYLTSHGVKVGGSTTAKAPAQPSARVPGAPILSPSPGGIDLRSTPPEQQ